MQERILVTGSRTGLGRFLTEKLSGLGLTKENSKELVKANQEMDFDLIIHCAWDHQNPAENPGLLEQVLNLRHKSFVFMSSSDVYSEDNSVHSESEELRIDAARSDYAKQKILCENTVCKKASRPIIIRPVSLLGYKECGENLNELMSAASPKLTLHEDSLWNFVSYDDVLTCIQQLRNRNFTGPINLARSEPVSVGTVANFLKKTPVYGNYLYKVAKLDNSFAKKFNPDLEETSFDFFKRWKAVGE